MTAKIPAKRAEKYGSLSTKQKDHHKGDPDARQAVAIGVAVTQASPTSDARERSNGMTEPDPSTTPPVRAGNRVDPDLVERIDQTKRDHRQRFIDKLGRRLSEPGAWVYQSDLALLNQCHTLLCESEHERDLYRAYTIQLLAERQLHEVTKADIAWAQSILANDEAVRS